MATVGGLVIHLALNTLGLSNGLAKADAQLAAFQATVTGQTAKAAGGFPAISAAAGLAGLAILGIAGASVKAATDFQYEMKLIRVQAGATSDELAHMSDALLDMAVSVKTGPDELAKGLFHIESVGLRGAQALDVLATAAKGAIVGNADLESVTNALIAANISGIKGITSMSQAMGILNGIVGTGNLRMQDLANSLSSGVLSTAKTFGLSIQDVGAALATMADQGIPAEEAATRLRITIALLGAPTKIAATELSRIGLTQRDLADEMRGPNGLIGALTMLKAHMNAAGLDATEQAQLLKTAFGGSRSSAGLLVLINSLDLMKNKLASINDKSGSFEQDFAEASKTAAAHFKELGAAIGVLEVRIGNGLLPVILPLVSAFSFLAQQTIIIVPLFVALTAAVTAFAAKALIGLLTGLASTVSAIATAVVSNWALAAAFAGLTVDTSIAASAEAAYAETLALTDAAMARHEALIAGVATSMAATAVETEAVAASMGPLIVTTNAAAGAAGELVAGIVGVDGAMAATTAGTGPLVAGIVGVDGAMVATAATTGELVAGIVGADGAMAATTASTGPLVAGLVGVDGAQVALAASTGPVITGLGLEETTMIALSRSSAELAVAEGGLAAASTGVGVAGGVAAAGLGEAGVAAASMAGLVGAAVVPITTLVIAFEALKNIKLPLGPVGDFISTARGDKLKKADGSPLVGSFNLFGGDQKQTAQDDAASTMQAAIDSMTNQIKTQMGDVTDATKTLVENFGTSLSGVEVAAQDAGSSAMAEYAKGILSAQNAPVDAFNTLKDMLKTSMTPTAEIARLVGVMTSSELAQGLASGDAAVVAQAEALQKAAQERLDDLTDSAYTAGTTAGAGWSAAFRDSILAGGGSSADATSALKEMDQAAIDKAKASYKELADVWKNQFAPSAASAAAALQGLEASVQDGTTSVDDAAKQIVSKIGEDFGLLKQVGETAGADLMGAVAQGLKERRDAPLNALKDLHQMIGDQFSRNREIALLYGELTSKDLAAGMASTDPAVFAQAQYTTKLITDELDKLTGGAYSASINAGKMLGTGLASTAPVVAAGTGVALQPYGTALGAAQTYGALSGKSSGKRFGDGMASEAGAVGSGTVKALAPFGAVVGAAVGFAALSGHQAGTAFAMNFANTAGGAVGAAGAHIAASMNGTVSWADILKQALAGAGSQTKYLDDQLAKLDGTVSGSASAMKSDLTSTFDAIKAKAHEFFDALHAANLKAIKDAHDHKNALLDAKEALNQAPVTAAQKALDFQRQAQEEWRLRQAVANATDPASQRDAILALQDFLAQKKIDMMQDEVDAANKSIDAQKKANDSKEAAQIAAEDKRYENQKKSFDRQLTALERFLKAHPAQWRKTNIEILQLLDKFGVSYTAAGSLLGKSFVSGLKAELAKAKKEMAAIAAAGAALGAGATVPANSTSQDHHAGNGGYALGAWKLGSDQFAKIHAGEMIIPPDLSESIRRVLGGHGMASIPQLLAMGLRAGDLSASGRITVPKMEGPRLPDMSLHAPDVSGRGSDGGGGGTIILKIGDEKLAEITDRALYVQHSIYGETRSVSGPLGSAR